MSIKLRLLLKEELFGPDKPKSTSEIPGDSEPVVEPTSPEESPAAELAGFVDVEDIDSVIDQDAEKIKDTLEGSEAPEPEVDQEEPTAGAETTTSATAITAEGLLDEDASSKALVDVIVGKSDGKLRFGGAKKGAYRLRLSNPKDDIAAIIKKSLRGFKVKVVAPGGAGAASSKYTTYVVAKSAAQIAKIVFSAGKNEGQKFEAQLKNSIASKKGPYWNALMAKLTEWYGIKPTDIAQVEKTAGGATAVKRPFTLKLQNVGPVLSDMNLRLTKPRNLGGTKTDKIYVSIKNVSGNTFANAGYSDGFVVTGTKVVAKPSGTRPEVDQFLTALGVDKNRVAAGLSDYLAAAGGKNVNSKHKITDTPAFNAKNVKNILAAQLGYGYVYVREGKGGLKILDVMGPQNATDLVGTINSVTIRYPYVQAGKASKQCTMIIETSMGRFTGELRNTQGGVVPQQLNLKMD